MINKEKILVTGGSGMAGRALQKFLPEAIYLNSKTNLQDPIQTREVFEKYRPEYVVHLAAKVGGLKANLYSQADFFTENVLINTNVVKACHDFKVKKLISILSTCVYPFKSPLPLKEEDMHNGLSHSSNYGYGFSKRMIDIHSRAYKEQYGDNFICIIPNNLYGPHDNFDLNNGHVIPSVMRKIFEGKKFNKEVVLWGDGTAKREFTYSNDLAKIILFFLENYDGLEPINVGNTNEITIKELANLISKIYNYEGEIKWNEQFSEGLDRKPSENSKFLSLGWDVKNYTNLEDGLKETCRWLEENYPNIRGI